MRKLNKNLDTELKASKETMKKTEISFIGDLDSIRKELTRATKTNQDLEVTNCELKEEVCTIDLRKSGHLCQVFTRHCIVFKINI